jgi:hypothetical protein
MTLTNALLSIGFSFAANFTNGVRVPADALHRQKDTGRGQAQTKVRGYIGEILGQAAATIRKAGTGRQERAR